MEKTRIWLDTDIGDDIDDTLVLEEILRNPALELVGISTVFKNTPLRAEFATRMLRAAGREDVPVLAGSPAPIRGLTPVRPHETFSQWDLEERTPDPGIYEEEAKDPHLVPRRILEEARKDPLAILAIAPLTNIARTILEDKEGVLSNSRLFLMGGEYREHRPEWNLECDVEAFKTILSSGLDIRAVGLELRLPEGGGPPLPEKHELADHPPRRARPLHAPQGREAGLPPGAARGRGRDGRRAGPRMAEGREGSPRDEVPCLHRHGGPPSVRPKSRNLGKTCTTSAETPLVF